MKLKISFLKIFIISKDINELNINNAVNISNLYLSNIKKAKSAAIIIFLIQQITLKLN